MVLILNAQRLPADHLTRHAHESLTQPLHVAGAR